MEDSKEPAHELKRTETYRINRPCEGCKKINSGRFEVEVPAGKQVTAWNCQFCGYKNPIHITGILG